MNYFKHLPIGAISVEDERELLELLVESVLDNPEGLPRVTDKLRSLKVIQRPSDSKK